MKKLILSIALFASTITFGFSQSAQNAATAKTVTFKVKNNSALPHSYTIIAYEPNQNGNSTNGVMMGSYGTKQVTYPVGTRIYLANKAQVDVVMAGNRISNDKPFLVVAADNAGKTVNLR